MRAMQDLYVYYQVTEADAPVLSARVRAMQASLGQGQLKRRPGAADGRQTWMEVYQQVDAAFAGMLEAAVAAARLDELIAGPRHAEVFVDLHAEEAAPCA